MRGHLGPSKKAPTMFVPETAETKPEPSCQSRRGLRAAIRFQVAGIKAPHIRWASIAGSRTWEAFPRRIFTRDERAKGRPGKPEAAFVVSGVREWPCGGMVPAARSGARASAVGAGASQTEKTHSITPPSACGSDVWGAAQNSVNQTPLFRSFTRCSCEPRDGSALGTGAQFFDNSTPKRREAGWPGLPSIPAKPNGQAAGC